MISGKRRCCWNAVLNDKKVTLGLVSLCWREDRHLCRWQENYWDENNSTRVCQVFWDIFNRVAMTYDLWSMLHYHSFFEFSKKKTATNVWVCCVLISQLTPVVSMTPSGNEWDKIAISKKKTSCSKVSFIFKRYTVLPLIINATNQELNSWQLL